MSAILFEDIFDVRQLNPDGKKFEKGMVSYVFADKVFRFIFCYAGVTVNRVHCRGTTYDVDLVLGIRMIPMSSVDLTLPV